jgi:chemotaxis protein CheX
MTTATLSAVDVLVGATTDVFDTMVFRRLELRDTAWGFDTPSPGQIVGSVGFAGLSSGLVAFHTTIAAAAEITEAMLGAPADGASAAAVDAIGEITNMIAGAFRTRMARPGDAWAITVPTVTVGSDFYIKPITTGDRAVVSFTMDQHELYVELIITPAAQTA